MVDRWDLMFWIIVRNESFALRGSLFGSQINYQSVIRKNGALTWNRDVSAACSGQSFVFLMAFLSVRWVCLGFATIVTWLILPVVICLSQRLSHACLSINKFVLWNCEWLIKSVIVYLIIPYYLDNRGNSRANTCIKSRLLEGMYLLDKKPTQQWFFGDSW